MKTMPHCSHTSGESNQRNDVGLHFWSAQCQPCGVLNSECFDRSPSPKDLKKAIDCYCYGCLSILFLGGALEGSMPESRLCATMIAGSQPPSSTAGGRFSSFHVLSIFLGFGLRRVYGDPAIKGLSHHRPESMQDCAVQQLSNETSTILRIL